MTSEETSGTWKDWLYLRVVEFSESHPVGTLPRRLAKALAATVLMPLLWPAVMTVMVMAVALVGVALLLLPFQLLLGADEELSDEPGGQG